jgi:hypothetical protein
MSQTPAPNTPSRDIGPHLPVDDPNAAACPPASQARIRFAWESVLSTSILVLLPIVSKSRAISERNAEHEIETHYLLFGMMLTGSVFSLSVIRNPERSRSAKYLATVVFMTTTLIWSWLAWFWNFLEYFTR